jgi:hypothetical protein
LIYCFFSSSSFISFHFCTNIVYLFSLENLNNFVCKTLVVVDDERRKGSSNNKRKNKRYGKIALTGNSDCGCMPGECCDSNNTISSSSLSSSSPIQAAAIVGYDTKELESIPKSSILGVGCRAPIHHAHLREGEIVVDLGSGAGIDVFLSANKVGKSGKVIGIDMTDEMLDKASKAFQSMIIV